jgi:hypothetical protein
MVQFDPGTGLLSVPVWFTATAAAVLVVLAVLALARSGALKTLFALLAFGVVVYGGWMGWLMFDRLSNNERVDERRIYDQRIAEFTGRATTPGSVLSCLDSGSFDVLAAGCEKALFEAPENVAAAVAYMSARITLLLDGLELAARSDLNYDTPLNALRRGLEADRFGVVAYVISQQPNCLPQQCELLALLRDPNRVRANLQDKQFEALVAKYSPQWSQPSRVGGTPEAATARPSMPPPPGAPLSSRYELPSAASIPPVSIMNSEPTRPEPPSSGAPAATGAAPSSSNGAPPAARRPPAVRAPVARAPEAPPPVPLTPAPASPPAATTPPTAVNPPAR